MNRKRGIMGHNILPCIEWNNQGVWTSDTIPTPDLSTSLKTVFNTINELTIYDNKPKNKHEIKKIV